MPNTKEQYFMLRHGNHFLSGSGPSVTPKLYRQTDAVKVAKKKNDIRRIKGRYPLLEVVPVTISLSDSVVIP